MQRYCQKLNHISVFLSHDWGVGKSNHILVQHINEMLQQRNIDTWFDSDQLKQGDIMRHEILFGIQKCSIYVIFITQAYMNKVNSNDISDYCLYEFHHMIKDKIRITTYYTCSHRRLYVIT